ncbi:MAG: 30S ribosomal protein S19 [candidate division TM6 bacterium GW2011_GWE2_41_16]|nr:MAG: 30S ribosomal protein S19 [candidate division TM6 bacterium GW2011_GWE2_41_16]
MTRSAKKGVFVEPKLLDKVAKAKSSNKREVIKTWSRCSTILPDFVGITFSVHDGKKFISLFVTENMVGHKLGEFAPSRTMRAHSGQRKSESSAPSAPAAAPAAKAS